MGKAKREVEAMTLKDQTKKRLDDLRTNAELCLTNLDNLRARIRNAATNTGSEGALGSDLEAFYEKTKDNVSDIKEAADALSLEAPTAKAIEKLETAVRRALDDYSTYNAHLNALSNDVLNKKDSTKREMVFIAKETGIKIGRILSDLGKSATSFIMSWLKNTKEETARIQEIHRQETTGPEGAARAVGGAIETGVRATGRAAGEFGTALSEVASDAKEYLNKATPKPAKRLRRLASKAYTKAKGKAAEAMSDEVKAVAEAASNVVSSGISAVSNMVSSVPSIPPVAPVLPTLKSAAESLQTRINQHDEGIIQSLRDLEALRSRKGQPIVHAQKQDKSPKAPQPQNSTVEEIRAKHSKPRSSQSK